MKVVVLAGLVSLLAASAGQAQYVGNNPGYAPWGPGPAGMPKGVKMIVVSGDPATAGAYTIHMRYPAGYRIGPHRHPTEVSYKIITGGLTFGMGADTHSEIKSLTKGSSGVVPANTYYYASTSVGATLEFTGTGPLTIEYARAKDDPRK